MPSGVERSAGNRTANRRPWIYPTFLPIAAAELGSMTSTDQLDLRPGDWVLVRSEAEILATLDDRGTLDDLPFMPEMLAHCGQRYRVFKRADKTCDTVKWSGLRRMERTVHLDMLRCDGSAHQGCQAGCLMFWKEAWLHRADQNAAPPAGDLQLAGEAKPRAIGRGCSLPSTLRPRTTAKLAIAARPRSSTPRRAPCPGGNRNSMCATFGGMARRCSKSHAASRLPGIASCASSCSIGHFPTSRET